MNDESTPDIALNNQADTQSNLDGRGLFNVSPLIGIADTLPADAARYIANSKKVGTTPEGYKSQSKEYDKAIEQQTLPTHAPLPVADEMLKSQEHASIVKPDLGTFEASHSQLNFALDEIKGRGIARPVYELTAKKMLGFKLNDDDSLKLIDSSDKLSTHNQIMQNYKLNFAETVLPETVSGIVDFGRSIWESKDLIAGGAATTAGIYGTIGAIGGGLPGLAAGATTGAVRGGALGLTAGLVRDAFYQSAGEIKYELQNAPLGTPDKPIVKNETEMNNLAIGGGVLMSALQLVPLSVIAKRIPWVRKIVSPSALLKAVNQVGGERLRQALINIGEAGAARLAVNSGEMGLGKAVAESAAAQGVTQALQTIIGITTKSIGSTWDGSEDHFLQGIENAAADWRTNVPQVVKSTIVGGITGAVITGAGRAVGKGAEVIIPKKAIPNAETSIPSDPNAEPAPAPIVPTDLSGPQVPHEVTGTRALQLALVIKQQSEMVKGTKTNEHLPDSIDNIRQKTWEDAGVPQVWIDKEELNSFANDEKKAEAARKVIDSSGTAAANVNAPIRVEMKSFLRLVDQFPEAADLAKLEPEAPSAAKWKLKLSEADKQRQGIVDSVTPQIKPEDLTGLNLKASDQEWIALIKTKERVDDYEAKVRAALATTEERIANSGDTPNPADVTLAKDSNEVLARLQKIKDQVPTTQDYLSKSHAEFQTRTKSQDIVDEQAYLEQPTFTEAMDKVLPKTEILKVNRDQVLTRLEVSEAIKSEHEKKMDNVVALETQQNLVAEEEFQAGQIADDRHIQIVDDFLNNNREIGDLNRFQEEQKANGKPIYAIDPKTLTEGEKSTYESNKVLYDRGVFDPRGMSVIDAMIIFGAKSPDELLRILSETPTRDESIKSFVDFNKAAIENETKLANADFEKSALAQAYNKMTAQHIKEMKILRDKYWPSLKAGIKRIALDLPRLPELISKARETIGSTKVKELNANQWKIAERRSQKEAVKAILGNEVELAFREKENAAYNTQLAKETHIAVGKINKAFNWIANLGSERVQSQLKEAGSIYTDAINQILDVYNFDPKQKGQSKVDGYNRYVKQMMENGQAESPIPEEVMAWLTPKESAKELTVDQVLALTDRMKRIVHQARLKNKLMKGFETASTTDIIAADLETLAQEHPSYNEAKSVEAMGNIGPMEKLSRAVRGAEAMVQNIKSITTRLGQGILHNKWEQLIWQPIEGTGPYEGPYGLLALDRLQTVVRKRVEKGIKEYGPDFNKMGITKVFVPEFANIPLLNNGKLIKLDLFRLLQHMGTDSSKQRVENFGVSRDIVMKVLQRELTEKDFDFVQNTVWGTFKGLKERVGANHKTLTGEELQFLEPQSFEAFGKTYEGGYAPIKLRRDTNLSAIESLQSMHESFMGDKKTGVPFNAALEGIVRSPHTKERVDHNYTIDLDVDSFSLGTDEMLYNLTMGVPVRDVMTLVTNKTVAKSIGSIIGATQYTTFVNNIAGLTRSERSLYQLQHGKLLQGASQLFNAASGRYLVNLIAGSPTSLIANTLNFLEAQRKMGVVSGAKHLSLAFSKFLLPQSWGKWGEMIKFAAEGDPTLNRWSEGLDESASAFADIMPKKYLVKNKGYKLLSDGQDKMNHVLLSGLFGRLDAFMKTTIFHAAYNQYLSGEAPGHSIDLINMMSDADRHRNAMSYAGSVSAETTQRARTSDKAAIQKLPIIKEFARIFNDSRSVLNNTIQDFHNIGYDAKAGVKAWKEGNYEAANANFHGANSRLATMLFISLMTKATLSALQGKNPLSTTKDNEAEPISAGQIPEFLAYNLTYGLPGLVANNMIGANAPILRDFIWGVETGRGMSMPALGAANEVIKTTQLGIRALSDEMNFIEFVETLGENDWKHVLHTAGLITGGLPVNAFFKWMKILDNGNGQVQIPGGDIVLGATLGTIGQFTDKYQANKDDEALKKVIEHVEGKAPAPKQDSKKTDLQQVAEQAKEIAAKLNPLKPNAISENYYDKVKQLESRGKWNAGKADGAFGLYQMLESTWENLVDSPEGRKAKLTMNGRLSKNTRQQEIGMKILTEKNAAALRAAKVPVSDESLYFMHHFGSIPDAVNIYGNGKSNKLSQKVIAKYIVKNNPGLKGVKTVPAMREYIVNLLSSGQERVDKLSGR